MADMNLKVKCFRCQKEFDKTQVKYVASLGKETRYECHSCSRKATREPLLAGVEKPLVKKSYVCVRCNYKFNSKIKVCPCCSKSDRLADGNIALKDLI